MKTRAEYEKICETTFSLAGDAQAKRIEIDLLLDIRDLLEWIKNDILLQKIVKEREAITAIRIGTPIDSIDSVVN